MGRWIADDAALKDLLGALEAKTSLVLDTEFERVRTYWPRLALVQVSIDDDAALIDPLAFDELTELGLLLARRPWVMHSASEDLVALRPLLSAAPPALFDTQIAAGLAGLGQGLSYQKLVAQVLGVELAKSETRSDWIRRPLSAEQLRYAADDVIHLESLALQLGERLDALGRRSWVDQEGARHLAQAFGESRAINQHCEYRSAFRLDETAQRRLDALLRWREDLARRLNRPKTWIFDNACAMDLAQKHAWERHDLQRTMALQKGFPKASLDALAELLAHPPQHDDFRKAPAPFSRDEEQRYERLRDAVEKLAADLAIEPGSLAARRTLEARLREGRFSDELPPWRRDLLDQACADL